MANLEMLSSVYDYSRLKTRMKEHRYSIGTLAEDLDITRVSLSKKLNNHQSFTQDEIVKSAKLMDIDDDQIALYFFASVVNKK